MKITPSPSQIPFSKRLKNPEGGISLNTNFKMISHKAITAASLICFLMDEPPNNVKLFGFYLHLVNKLAWGGISLTV